MKRIVVLVVLLLVTAGTCESDSADETNTVSTTNDGASTTQEADDNNAASSNQSSGGADFETIWGIAPGIASVDAGFGAYSETDNEFSFTEDVLFMLDGSDRDEVIDYYRDHLVDEGYTISEVFEAGESRFFNASMDDDPQINGVVQVGPQSPENAILSVHQQRVRLKDQESPTDTGVVDSAVTEADGSVSDTG